MFTPERFYTTDQIKSRSHGKTHFFDAGSMRFFKSRIGQSAYATNNPFVTLFVTSEKYESVYSGTSEPRLYSIRVYDWRTGSVDTVGDFQEYETGRQANKAVKELTKKWEYTLDDMHEYANLINAEYDQNMRRAKHLGYFYCAEAGIGHRELV